MLICHKLVVSNEAAVKASHVSYVHATAATSAVSTMPVSWEVVQIIHLSPVGCFTPARGKTVQKKCEINRVNVWVLSWAPHYLAILQNWQEKDPKISLKEQQIMKYLPGLSHDTKPLSWSTGNRAKVLLKGHLTIKHYPQYKKVSRLIQHSSI